MSRSPDADDAKHIFRWMLYDPIAAPIYTNAGCILFVVTNATHRLHRLEFTCTLDSHGTNLNLQIMDIVSRPTFIGALSCLFPNQVQNDIYLDHYWTKLGLVRRITFATARWGVCVASVQVAVAILPGHPGAFFTDPGSLNLITVSNQGILPAVPFGLPHIHQQGPFMINGNLIQGYVIIWHRKYSIVGHPIGRLLHYHEHEERVDHGPYNLDIKPQGVGRHLAGRKLIIGTQVQGFRQMARN